MYRPISILNMHKTGENLQKDCWEIITENVVNQRKDEIILWYIWYIETGILKLKNFSKFS